MMAGFQPVHPDVENRLTASTYLRRRTHSKSPRREEQSHDDRELQASDGSVTGVGVFVTDPMPLTPQKGLSTTGALHLVFGGSALMLLPFAALLVNLSLALKNPAWAPARRALLWTAGLPLLGLIGFMVHLAVVVMPMGDAAYGPGVPLGWPPRFHFLSYMVWLITLAAQTIRLRSRRV